MNSATVIRPDVPHPAPPGYRWEAEEAPDDWAPADPGRKCRWNGSAANRACGMPAVVKKLRGLTRRVWWQYCLEHGDGRWTENGRVMQWVLREREGRPAGS